MQESIGFKIVERMEKGSYFMVLLKIFLFSSLGSSSTVFRGCSESTYVLFVFKFNQINISSTPKHSMVQFHELINYLSTELTILVVEQILFWLCYAEVIVL